MLKTSLKHDMQVASFVNVNSWLKISILKDKYNVCYKDGNSTFQRMTKT